MCVMWTDAPAEAGAKVYLSGARKMELVSGSHRVGQSVYHLEWCPEYRYRMFNKEKNKKAF